MQKITDINHINEVTLDGRYLLAALTILTTSKNVTIMGQELDGQQMTPFEMLDEIGRVVEAQCEIYGALIERELEAPKTFINELTDLTNRYSLENVSNTPDFLLAKYLLACLDNYSAIVAQRDKWFNIDPWTAGKKTEELVSVNNTD